MASDEHYVFKWHLKVVSHWISFFQRHQIACFSMCLPWASGLLQFMPVINMRFQNAINKNQGVAIYDIIKRVHIVIN